MARGWESKSVEAQQDEASAGRPADRRPMSGEDRDRAQRRRTLELARAKAAADLRRATSEAHRAMLRQAIADLDEHIGRD